VTEKGPVGKGRSVEASGCYHPGDALRSPFPVSDSMCLGGARLGHPRIEQQRNKSVGLVNRSPSSRYHPDHHGPFMHSLIRLPKRILFILSSTSKPLARATCKLTRPSGLSTWTKTYQRSKTSSRMASFRRVNRGEETSIAVLHLCTVALTTTSQYRDRRALMIESKWGTTTKSRK